ncbi:MAG: acylphosphatase [Planctomycetota bacterium]
MKSQAHLLIKGTVQGVCYRANTRDKAQSLGLSGWVRNIPGGNVEAVFCGDREIIEQMINWCRKGPHGAMISEITTSWESPQDNSNSFEILY